MFTYLQAHPEIAFSSTKEPHYFGHDHRRINHQPRTEAQYLDLFAGAKNERWVGDASTSYLHSSTAAEEIRAFSSDPKMVIMLREPVDVMYALHGTVLADGFEFIEDFPKALEVEEARQRGQHLPRIRPGLLENLLYRETVRYHSQVKRYLDVFGSRVHIILYDDFAADTPGVHRKLLEFLEIDPSFQPRFEVVNASARPRSTKFNNFLWNPPRPLQAAVQSILPAEFRTKLVNKLKGLNVKKQARPPLEAAFRAQLNSELAGEMDRLGSLIGRDLSHWCGRKNANSR